MNDTQKTDFLFKKSLGVPFTNPGAPPYTESDFEAYKRVIPSRQIYSQEIPATTSLVTLGAATPVSGGGTKKVGTGTYSYIERYEDIPLSNIISGLSYRNTLMVDAIPPLYDTGLSYAITVKLNGSTIPQSSTDHPWFFDSDAGILIFTNGANTAGRDNKLTASFWRYAGTKGLGSGGGGVGDAADDQLLYNNSGSVSGSSITYVPGGTATYTYTGSAEKYTGIAVGTKTYTDGSRRYVLGRMQQLIPTASTTLPYPRPADGFYGGVTDLPSSRQPFNDMTYDPSHNIVTKTFYHTDGYTYALVAIGNRVAWRDASGADTVGWVTYDLPAGEIIYDVAYGVTFTDSRLMVVTESLRYMTVTFVSGQPLTFSALTDINGRTGIQQQGNHLSGLYFFETAIRMTAFIPFSRVAWVPSRVFMVTYRRDTAVNDINLQRNVSVLQASCQAVSSTYSNDFTTAANNYYTNLMSAPLAFKYAPYGIMTLVIDSPTVTNVLVGYNVVWGITALYGNVIKSRVFGFYQGTNIYNPSIMSILAFINTNSYDTNYTFYEASRYETIYNYTNGEFYNYAIYNLGDANNFITRTRSMRYHVISPSANRYTIFPYSSSNAFQPILIDFNNISGMGYYYPIDSPNYDCSNTLVVTHPYSNYLLAAETPNVLSIKRYSYGDASNNTLEGRTAYPTYTSINGIVSYAAVPGTQQTTDLSASNVEAVAGSTSIASTAKNARYTNGTQQATTTTRAPILEVNDIGVMMLPNKTLQINSTSWNGGLRFGTAPTQTSSLNYMIQRGPPNVDYRYGRWQNSIIVHIPDNSDNNFAVLSPNATPRLVVNTGNGNVGIGTADPPAKLSITDISNAQLQITNSYTNSSSHAEETFSRILLAAVASNNPSTFGCGMQLRVPANATINESDLQFTTCNNSANQIVRMTIKGSSNSGGGNVGIGTTTPEHLLDISGGSARITKVGAQTLILRNPTIGESPVEIFFDKTAADASHQAAIGLDATGSRKFFIWINGGDKLRMDLDGNVAIGSGASPTAAYKLAVTGKTSTQGLDSYDVDINVYKAVNPAVAVNTGTEITVTGTSIRPRGGMYLGTAYNPPRLIFDTVGFILPIELQSTKVIISNSPSWNVGVGTDVPLPHAKMQIHRDIPASEFLHNNPLPGQLILTATTQRLILGATYTADQLGTGYIQSSYVNNNQDYFTDLLLSPRGGRVGIGTLQTNRAMLNVGYGTTNVNSNYGSQLNNSPSFGWAFPVWYDRPGDNDPGAQYTANSDVSIYTFKSIWCDGTVLATSDMRIKENMVEINDGDALKKLRLIEPTSYEYVDKRRGDSRVFGFLAQQVREHFPEATSIQTNFIPNFYQFCHASFNETRLTLVDISNREVLASVIPGKTKIKIFDITINEHTPPIVSVDASAGTLTFDISGLGVTEDVSGGKMFLYGMEVDDFHTLNKDYLFTINFAATQEIDREVQRLRADNTALTGRVATLESQNAALQQKLDALLSRLGITDL